MPLDVKDANAVVKSLKTSADGIELVPHHNVDALPWATQVVEDYISMPAANTQYTHAAPHTNVKRFEFKCRGLVDVRFAFTTGKVATPAEPYYTLRAGQAYDSGPVAFASLNIYFALPTGVTNQVIELLIWR